MKGLGDIQPFRIGLFTNRVVSETFLPSSRMGSPAGGVPGRGVRFWPTGRHFRRAGLPPAADATDSPQGRPRFGGARPNILAVPQAVSYRVPGQHLVTDWPVLDPGAEPDVTEPKFRLDVDGAVENHLSPQLDEFVALPMMEDVSDMHGVDQRSRYDNHWTGKSITPAPATISTNRT